MLQKLEKKSMDKRRHAPVAQMVQIGSIFSLTKEGEERVSVFWQQWDDLSQKVEGIKNGWVNHDENEVL